MRKYIYIVLALIPVAIVGLFSNGHEEYGSMVGHAYADLPNNTGYSALGSSSTVNDSCNCNSSAPDGTSSNGADGSGTG